MVGIDNENEFGPDLSIGDKIDVSPNESVDAGDVDWKATAEALQEELDKRPTYPYEDNDITHLSPDVSVTHDGAWLYYNGVIYVPQQAKDLQPQDLKKYSIGEHVEVQKNGDWHPGVISSKQAGHLDVDTARGPVTVMSYHIIRKVNRG